MSTNSARDFFKKEAQRLLDPGKVSGPVCRYEDVRKRFSAEIVPNEGVVLTCPDSDSDAHRAQHLRVYASWLAHALMSASLPENLGPRDDFILTWQLLGEGR